MFSSSRKRGGADAFENDPSFIDKPTVQHMYSCEKCDKRGYRSSAISAANISVPI
jgi:hypothetical protein